MKRISSLVVVTILFLSIFSTITLQIKAEPSETSIKLYAGTTNPGIVWEYKGGSNWESITENPSSLGWSVTSLISYEGALYASTISDTNIYSSFGRVWKYKGSKTWESVSEGLEANQVTFLIIYKGELYAGTATPARLYKYNPATSSWSKVLEYAPWFGFRSAYIWGDWLYLGEWYWDRFARWNGITFQEFQPNYWGSCIYSFEEYKGALYAGAYIGSIYKITAEPPVATAIWGPEPNYRYAWTLKSFKGYLYIGFDAGSAGVAPLYRYDGTWFIQVWSYVTATTNAHEGIISMANDGTYLYAGVGAQAVGYPTDMSGVGSGRVYKSLDGINFELISGIMGTGVQTLYCVPSLPDLTISEIKPVQVIWDCDINNDGKVDLVVGKATAIFVSVNGFEQLSDDVIIDVKLTFEGTAYTQSNNVASLRQKNKIIFSFVPKFTGDQTIKVEVDPFNKITESDETNNAKETDVSVKDTRGLRISYIKVNSIWPATYGAPSQSEFIDTAMKSGIFINATYPVAGNEFKNELRSEEYYGDPVPILGLTDDLISLAFWKWVLGAGDRIVGVVSDNYFPYHHQGDAVGISNPSITRDAALVTNGYWTTAAHEIAHTYGLNLPRWVWWPPHWESTEEYDVNPPGNPANGYWVDKGIEISNGICFMGYAPSKHTYDYWPGRSVWVCDETYENLFREFRVDQTDPDVLVVGGIVYKNGTLSLTKWYYVENRTIEYPMQGNYSITSMDWDGEVISRINFTVGFYLMVEPYGLLETNVTGFVFPIPFVKNTAIIKIQYNNATIEINPNTKLLHDAIDSIPDYGFVDCPQCVGRRKALHNKIDAIEKMLKQNLIIDARNKLKFDLRDKLEKWLINDYKKTDPLQLSKNEILALVDEIINRLDMRLAQKAVGALKELRVEIETLPDEAFSNVMASIELKAELLNNINDIIDALQTQTNINVNLVMRLELLKDKINQLIADVWKDRIFDEIETAINLLEVLATS